MGSAARLSQHGAVQVVTVCIWGGALRPGPRPSGTSCQICIKLQVDDKYDFTSQFIRWKYKC
jgi:hypothetical protein